MFERKFGGPGDSYMPIPFWDSYGKYIVIHILVFGAGIVVGWLFL